MCVRERESEFSLCERHLQDLPRAASKSKVAEEMHLSSLRHTIKWYIQSTNAVSGEVIYAIYVCMYVHTYVCNVCVYVYMCMSQQTQCLVR